MSVTNNPTPRRTLARMVFILGLVTLNYVAFVPSARAETGKPDECWIKPIFQGCYCATGPTHECLYDSECKGLYPTVCQNP